MSSQDIKLAILNSLTLGLSFTTIESGLKIILLIASITYTILKIYDIYKNGKNK